MNLRAYSEVKRERIKIIMHSRVYAVVFSRPVHTAIFLS
jgi:hypothetical protein